MTNKKIVSFETLIKKTRELKHNNKSIVLCSGIFETLHIGHMRYLRQARSHGDIVIAAIISDKYIDRNKTLAFDENLRAEAVASLDWVDAVVINPFDTIHELISLVSPNVFVKGFETAVIEETSKKSSEQELTFLKNTGTKLIITKENEFTSSAQINRYFSNLPYEIKKYIELFKERHTFDELVHVIEDMKKLQVLVIGDMIIDEYQYCSAIGKSSKDPTLVLKYESRDVFVGGAGAVANHIADFAGRVDLVTILGEQNSHEKFIRSHLNKNIFPHFFHKPDAPTLIKRRFLDGYSTNKLFEVYIMDDSFLNGRQGKQLFDLVNLKLPEYDLVIVADFGHGTIDTKTKKLLSEKALFLSVNAQSNAGNRGFNSITKYPNAHYLTLAEHEIRLEMRDLSGKLFPMMSHIHNRMKCKKIIVTRGRNGCVVLDQNGEFLQIPSFAQKVVDRVGAGDALFGLTSLAAVQNIPGELLGFIGNTAGSLAVETMGNKKSIDKRTIMEYMNKLLT
ncbi:MAG: PfkB family carbohydrate kinase [Candidatus Brocadiaceae bacterium]|nr:PfkB family carbohydrate kinase [Candidatus Brocadiaceae bacterium]